MKQQPYNPEACRTSNVLDPSLKGEGACAAHKLPVRKECNKKHRTRAKDEPVEFPGCKGIADESKFAIYEFY